MYTNSDTRAQAEQYLEWAAEHDARALQDVTPSMARAARAKAEWARWCAAEVLKMLKPEAA